MQDQAGIFESTILTKKDDICNYTSSLYKQNYCLLLILFFAHIKPDNRKELVSFNFESKHLAATRTTLTRTRKSSPSPARSFFGVGLPIFQCELDLC